MNDQLESHNTFFQGNPSFSQHITTHLRRDTASENRVMSQAVIRLPHIWPGFDPN